MEKGRMVVTGRVEEVTARVMGAAEMLVEVIAGEDACTSLLEGHPRVKSIRRSEKEFAFEFDGGPAEASDLLAALLAGGVRVVSFTRKKENLEEVFLKVGAKEVS
jgi:ABC-2 type transport system ATP-binding protein